MQLKEENLEKLKIIIQKDYGIDLATEDANQLGLSLLKLSRLAHSALNKVEEVIIT